MPNFQGILINAATMRGKCAVCNRSLDDEASLNITFGFRTKCFCPSCLTKILEGYPTLEGDLETARDAVIGLQKQIDSLKKEIKDGGKKESRTKAQAAAVS